MANTQVCYQHAFDHKCKEQTYTYAMYLYTMYEKKLFLHLVVVF